MAPIDNIIVMYNIKLSSSMIGVSMPDNMDNMEYLW